MASNDSVESSSAPQAATPATQATLCSLMADETRIRILRELYAVRTDGADREGLPFSTLRRRVDVDDSGRFNYHVDQLTDQLVCKRVDRYVLTPTGERLVAALVDPTD